MRRRRREANQRLGRFAKFVWGGLGLGALVAAYAAALAYELLPAPKQFASDMMCRARDFFQEPAPGSQFTILISNLSGDTDGRQTNRIRDVFVGQRGVDVRRTCRSVGLGSTGGSMVDAETEALADGYALLQDRNADILIWGEVKKADEELSVWFLSRKGDTTLGSRSYSVSDGLILPADFKNDLAAQLQTVAFAQIVPKESADRKQLIALLTPAAERLRNLLSEGGDLLPEPNAALLYRFGQAATSIGVYEEDPDWLELAVAAYRKVVASQWSRERVALGWASAQQDLGTTLYRLGELRGDPAQVDEAAVALLGSLEEWTRAKVWPRVEELQSFLANEVLPNLAVGAYLDHFERSDRLVEPSYDAPHLFFDSFSSAGPTRTKDALQEIILTEEQKHFVEKAIGLYQLGLEVWSRNTAPNQWATIQENLSDLLFEVGIASGDLTYLEQSVVYAKRCLVVWTFETAPLAYAKQQYRLGTKLIGFSPLKTDMHRAQEAINAFNAALKILDQNKQKNLWWAARINLGTAVKQSYVKRRKPQI